MPTRPPPVLSAVPLVTGARRARASKLQWFLCGVLIGLAADILIRAAGLVIPGLVIPGLVSP